MGLSDESIIKCALRKRTKLDELKNVVNEIKPDIMAFTEIRLIAVITDSKYHFEDISTSGEIDQDEEEEEEEEEEKDEKES
ncbi:unnamed protein product [Schistocephalus solidus]|uniref:Uncharacterized protein n=1 Tax=Schistocephalus solidus TaxID=70667 RepID=A0A3P7D7L8_SCHSO|nr:unnamed protein product [Schistocephalus solidus]